jgi:hypothetical protein
MLNSFAGDAMTSLKRKFESVVENFVKEELIRVKGEVSDLRHEVKKIRLHSEIMWFSAPGMLSNPFSLLSLPANVI